MDTALTTPRFSPAVSFPSKSRPLRLQGSLNPLFPLGSVEPASRISPSTNGVSAQPSWLSHTRRRTAPLSLPIGKNTLTASASPLSLPSRCCRSVGVACSGNDTSAAPDSPPPPPSRVTEVASFVKKTWTALWDLMKLVFWTRKHLFMFVALNVSLFIAAFLYSFNIVDAQKLEILGAYIKCFTPKLKVYHDSLEVLHMEHMRIQKEKENKEKKEEERAQDKKEEERAQDKKEEKRAWTLIIVPVIWAPESRNKPSQDPTNSDTRADASLS